jgi:NTE family protein
MVSIKVFIYPFSRSMMDKKLAFVLSGGGSRGALQVGALYALLESGIQPDFLIGASIGAVNSAFIAMNGFSKESLDQLSAAWRKASASDLLPANYVWLTVRAMFKRSSNDPSRRLRDFFVSHGLTPELSFKDIVKPNLVIVSTDLNTGRPILHGALPEDKILDALLLSTALPPWFMPVRKQDRYLMDGGVVSNLPVEPALRLGATEIVALDLIDSREMIGTGEGVRGFIDRLLYTVEKRQIDLELELAEARGIPVLYLNLTGETPVTIWDFKQSDRLIDRGYALARCVIEDHRFAPPMLAKDS